nr:MAG TPA: hypothetical protein [Caudoviricetes sp.]
MLNNYISPCSGRAKGARKDSLIFFFVVSFNFTQICGN